MQSITTEDREELFDSKSLQGLFARLYTPRQDLQMFSRQVNRRPNSGYRSSRSVRRQETEGGKISGCTRTRKILTLIAIFALSMTILLPVALLELSTTKSGSNPHSIHNVMSISREILVNHHKENSVREKKFARQPYKEKPPTTFKDKPNEADRHNAKSEPNHYPEKQNPIQKLERATQEENVRKPHVDQSINHSVLADNQIDGNKIEAKSKPNQSLDKPERIPLDQNIDKKSPLNRKILARGVAGLPMSQTPALEGAKWAHIECDADVDDYAYWNDPQGKRDQNFKSPFAKFSDNESKHRYLTFQPDPGGWNNIRMSMEIIFTLAATTGRTLVLPPKAPFYLLGMGEKNARSFGSFYDISKDSFQKEVEVISMEEFFEREVFSEKKTEKPLLDFLNDTEIKELKDNEIPNLCVYREGAKNHCDNLYTHLKRAGYQPDLEAGKNCFVFDQDVFHGQNVSDELSKRATKFCGKERTPIYYNQTMHEPKLLHWDGTGVDAFAGGHRLLNHFYAFLFYSDPVIDNHYKRFVRDFLHYKDSLYCAAGKIINALNREGKEWSTLHVRRGDLQYKEVKISAEEWYENLKEIWNEGELLFIATDERNKTFFDPIKKHHDLRFLDDYFEVGNLSALDPYFLGMVDTIVASHGRTFAGTWFSTFTGYINRMRGYLGYSIKDSWYSYLPRKDAVRDYKLPSGNYGAREWPIGWIAIDGDEVIEHEGTPLIEIDNTNNASVEEFQRKVREVKKVADTM